ncbi:flagellar type III secretion system protein FliQ, partial [bacterium]|nr:flagellar type III secretion system protein FliQ [bacterium]
MTEQLAIYLTSHTLTTALMVSAPMLLAGLIVGVILSIFMAVTQINEMTLTFVPKIVVTLLALMYFLPWMSQKL